MCNTRPLMRAAIVRDNNCRILVIVTNWGIATQGNNGQEYRKYFVEIYLRPDHSGTDLYSHVKTQGIHLILTIC